MIKEKRIRSGKLLEIDLYPAFDDGRRIPERASGTRRSTLEQEKYNRMQSVKRCVRIVNANFDNTDHFAHFTYFAENAPESVQAARAQFKNYLRRVARKRTSTAKRIRRRIERLKAGDISDELASVISELEAKEKKLCEEFKYFYVIEETVYKTGRYAGLVRYHFHAFITGGLENSEIEDLWTLGERARSNYFDPERYGPEAAAKYMSKELSRERRIGHSLNLKKPEQLRLRKSRVTARGIERIAKERVDDREYWEKRYPGYRFLRCFARYNNYNGHWYVSAVMYKDSGAPVPWSFDDELWTS